YRPSKKTDLHFELAGSKHDQNLFSNLDDGDNDGFAGRLTLDQNLITSRDSTRLTVFGKFNFIHKNFQSIEPLYNVEFNRDWNLEAPRQDPDNPGESTSPQDSVSIEPRGHQIYLDAGLEYSRPKTGFARYHLQKLEYAGNFNGIRQVLNSQLHFGDFSTRVNSSFLKSNGQEFSSEFFRLK